MARSGVSKYSTNCTVRWTWQCSNKKWICGTTYVPRCPERQLHLLPDHGLVTSSLLAGCCGVSSLMCYMYLYIYIYIGVRCEHDKLWQEMVCSILAWRSMTLHQSKLCQQGAINFVKKTETLHTHEYDARCLQKCENIWIFNPKCRKSPKCAKLLNFRLGIPEIQQKCDKIWNSSRNTRNLQNAKSFFRPAIPGIQQNCENIWIFNHKYRNAKNFVISG